MNQTTSCGVSIHSDCRAASIAKRAIAIGPLVVRVCWTVVAASLFKSCYEIARDLIGPARERLASYWSQEANKQVSLGSNFRGRNHSENCDKKSRSLIVLVFLEPVCFGSFQCFVSSMSCCEEIQGIIQLKVIGSHF